MDPDRARDLLAAERMRIEGSLARLERQDSGEPADELDPTGVETAHRRRPGGEATGALRT
jgi:hypothetical protein